MKINAGADVHHAHQRESGGDEGNDALDSYVLNGVRVVLDAVDGVGGPVTVMEGEGQALDVVEKFGAEVPNQLLTGVGLQVPAGQTLKIGEQSDGEEQGDREAYGQIGRASCRERGQTSVAG